MVWDWEILALAGGGCQAARVKASHSKVSDGFRRFQTEPSDPKPLQRSRSDDSDRSDNFYRDRERERERLHCFFRLMSLEAV